jgi:DNA-binding phage protein
MVVTMAKDADAAALSRSLNILRTHYTASQRAMFAAKRAALKHGDVNSQLSQRDNTMIKFNHRPVDAARVAKEAGVSRQSVVNAKRIRREGSPEIIAASLVNRNISIGISESMVREPPAMLPGKILRLT